MAEKKKKRATEAKKPIDFDVIEPLAQAMPAANEAVDALEAVYGALPDRYREFMTRFGAGEYRGGFFVYNSAAVHRFTKENRAFIRDNLDLWDDAAKEISADDLERLVFLAHTTGGELGMLGYVGGAPERLLFFPRPSTGFRMEEMGPTFAHAIARWFEED